MIALLEVMIVTVVMLVVCSGCNGFVGYARSISAVEIVMMMVLVALPAATVMIKLKTVGSCASGDGGYGSTRGGTLVVGVDMVKVMAVPL